MAKIGLSNLWYSELTEGSDGTATYAGPTRLAKAVTASVEITNNEASLYADDTLAENDTSFASGTISLTVDEDDDTVFAALLGHTVSNGEVVKKSTDTAPYVGIGRVVTKMVNGVYKYKAEFLYKVKFATPSSEENTKGESIEFATPTIEGVIAALGDTEGTWSKTKTFTDKDDAVDYIKGLLAGPSL